MVSRELLTGCCGFPQALVRYCRSFPVVEVQQTFYQPPAFKTLERWRRQAPAEFEFALKAWQLITHESSSPTYRRLREKLTEKQKREVGAFRLNPTVMAAWQRTLDCARALGSRLILFQCPARFTPTPQNKSNLRCFFREVWPGIPGRRQEEGFTLLWEPRGEWKSEEVRELCEELGLVHAVDPFLRQPATSGLGYFRLHGRTGYRYRFTDSDLEELLDTARAHTPCYVLFNNVSMLDDARRFLRLARQE
jgi:uncharacterized protein YecE (DUF72 family)